MMGEGFDDGGRQACSNRSSGVCGDATWMLLATSGLQFGVFNDMLTDVNLFRGMVFGMAGRPPYSNAAQNNELYRFWDSSGISANGTEMLGFWSGGYGDGWAPVVSTGAANIQATAYVVKKGGGHLVIAVASWATENVTFTLRFDHDLITKKLPGWSPSRVRVIAPEIPLIQNATETGPQLTVVPRGGVLLLVEPHGAGDRIFPSQ